jgi:hypothetical protein
MCWCRQRVLLLLLAGAATPALADKGDYLLGGGIESDTDATFAGSLFAERALSDGTWLSLAAARTRVDIERSDSLDTSYADLGIDHNFDPVGVRLSAAYWGDNDILDSLDGRLSVYLRQPRFTLAVDAEYRDFELDFPPLGQFPGRDVGFDASGFGATATFRLTDRVGLSVFGIDYEYSVDLRLDQNRPIARFLNVSRLSLINSLVDYRAGGSINVDRKLSRLSFAYQAWRGAVDGSMTHSFTGRFMTPLGDRSDIEVGVGYDNSELYGDVIFLSLFLFYYGGK